MLRRVLVVFVVLAGGVSGSSAADGADGAGGPEACKAAVETWIAAASACHQDGDGCALATSLSKTVPAICDRRAPAAPPGCDDARVFLVLVAAVALLATLIVVRFSNDGRNEVERAAESATGALVEAREAAAGATDALAAAQEALAAAAGGAGAAEDANPASEPLLTSAQWTALMRAAREETADSSAGDLRLSLSTWVELLKVCREGAAPGPEDGST